MGRGSSIQQNSGVWTDQRNVSEMLNVFFFYINVTLHIGVPDAIKENDSVSEIVEHHCNHPTISFNKNNVEIMSTVMFDLVSNDDILKSRKSLYTTRLQDGTAYLQKMISMVAIV